MYDLFFISYEEPNADSNWKKLKHRFDYAKRIHGITGISNAHLACAKSSLTKMFWTVDGDTVVNDDWDFSYQPPVWDQKYLHLWYSKNPIHDSLEYGYGSVKLWPKQPVISHASAWLDFTTSIGDIKIIEQTIATTYFNTGVYETWKSSFRECVKLSENIKKDPVDEFSIRRRFFWGKPNIAADFSEWSIKGCDDAVEYFEAGNDLLLINNFAWLKEFFVKKYDNI